MGMEPQRPSHVIGTRMGELVDLLQGDEKGEPSVLAGYLEPAWLENGFETELGTFKFEVG